MSFIRRASNSLLMDAQERRQGLRCRPQSDSRFLERVGSRTRKFRHTVPQCLDEERPESKLLNRLCRCRVPVGFSCKEEQTIVSLRAAPRGPPHATPAEAGCPEPPWDLPKPSCEMSMWWGPRGPVESRLGPSEFWTRSRDDVPGNCASLFLSRY